MTDGRANPLISQLRELGVSGPYASQITTGARKPSLALALKIYAATQQQFGPLLGKTEAEIEVLRQACNIGAGRVA